MMRQVFFVVALAGSLFANASSVLALSIDLKPAQTNVASPHMGDHLHFKTVIRNDGALPLDGVIAWISLVQTDKGKEQPVDLEDWSAHKAITAQTLQPGETVETDWPMRLIQAGTYRVVISAATREGSALSASPFADFMVRPRPVVESQRILPIALGIPALLIMIILWRRPTG